MVASLLQASESKGSAVSKRETVHKEALANQAAAHFRWRSVGGNRSVGALDMDRKSFKPKGRRATKRFQGAFVQ